ncbi:MAG: hypothetical protein ACQETE_16305 [Bacteroidota bacterium]
MKASFLNRLPLMVLLIFLPVVLSGCYTQLRVSSTDTSEPVYQDREEYYDGYNSGFEYRDYQTYRYWNPYWMDVIPYTPYPYGGISLGWYNNPFYSGWMSSLYYYNYPYRWNSYYWRSAYGWGSYYPYSYWGYRNYYPRHYDYGEKVVRASGLNLLRYDAIDLDGAGLDRLGRIDRYRSGSSAIPRLRSNQSSYKFPNATDQRIRIRDSGTRVRSSSGNRSRSGRGNSSSSGSNRTDRSRSGDN